MSQRSTLTLMIVCLLVSIRKKFGRFRLAARRLVASSRREIATVAAALLRHGTLSGDQIIELTHDRNESLSLQSQW